MMELTGSLKLSQHSFVLSSPIHLFESACADFIMLCICIFWKKWLWWWRLWQGTILYELNYDGRRKMVFFKMNKPFLIKMLQKNTVQFHFLLWSPWDGSVAKSTKEPQEYTVFTWLEHACQLHRTPPQRNLWNSNRVAVTMLNFSIFCFWYENLLHESFCKTWWYSEEEGSIVIKYLKDLNVWCIVKSRDSSKSRTRRRTEERFASFFKVHFPLEHNHPMEACLRAQCNFIMSEKAHLWLCGSLSSSTWFACSRFLSFERWKVLLRYFSTTHKSEIVFESLQGWRNAWAKARGLKVSSHFRAETNSCRTPDPLPPILLSRQYLSCQTRAWM